MWQTIGVMELRLYTNTHVQTAMIHNAWVTIYYWVVKKYMVNSLLDYTRQVY